MKKPFEMTFEEFTSAAKLSGSVNRLPEMQRGMPVYSYSVFINGEVSAELATNSRSFTFPGVMVTALTSNLGLDRHSFHDNLKVAELTAARNVWLESVSAEHHRNRAWGLEDLPGDILKDYEQLSKGMFHPFIRKVLDEQVKLSKNLKSALSSASIVAGKEIEDLAPDEVSVGKVVSQSLDFLVQETSNGEIVTHETRRLERIPKNGAQITVSYYRGSGQVVDSMENVKVSAPFIDQKSNDLGVVLIDGKGKKQVILFNTLVGFDKFVKAHELDLDLVRQAVDVKSEIPKFTSPEPRRTPARPIYFDKIAGCLTLDYTENGVEYSVLFGNAKDLETQAEIYGVSPLDVSRGKSLEIANMVVNDNIVKTSLDQLCQKISLHNVENIAPEAKNGHQYTGRVLEESALHIAQDMGRKVVMFHDKRDLDKVPQKGEHLTVKYENGRGKVEELVRNPTERGR